MTSPAPVPFGLLFMLVGVVLIAAGVALIANVRGAADWFIAFARRQKELFGSGWAFGADHTRGSVARIGVVYGLLGLVFLVVGLQAVAR